MIEGIRVEFADGTAVRVDADKGAETLRSIALPSLALGMTYTALIARITRASMLEVLSEDYIRTAHAKGVATVSVVVREGGVSRVAQSEGFGPRTK